MLKIHLRIVKSVIWTNLQISSKIRFLRASREAHTPKIVLKH